MIPFTKLTDLVQKKPWVGWALFLGALGGVFLLGVFATTIMERRAESRKKFEWVTPVSEWEANSAVWGKNFPREFETWKQTREGAFRSKYNGSVERDMLEEDPRWVVLWAGYPFSREYNQSRGHAHAVEDVQKILRTDETNPGTCWTCKSSDIPGLMNKMGVAEFYKEKWIHLGDKVHNSIGCLDCHDPKSMNLRISRPALKEAFARQGKNVDQASLQEKRSLVCAQCHVEYYFKGDGKYLTFPWDQGTTVEAIEKYYDEAQFKDWVHGLSRTPMIKPQHPDWELFQTGIHAQRGLACADCHMPYKVEGGTKVSNHHLQSPLNDISNTCQVCHRESEETLRNNVYERQDKVLELQHSAETALVRAHIEAKKAWELGATEAEMKPILTLIRHAQWRCDYVAASHGAPFHAPLESARILGTSLEKADEARLQLARLFERHGFHGEVPMPNLSTKAMAQKYIGLDMAALHKHQDEIKRDLLPKWNAQSNDTQ